MRAARRRLLPVIVPDLARKPWAPRLTDEFRSGACHAGRYEGSVIMAERPELVRERPRARCRPTRLALERDPRGQATTFEEAGGPSAYFGWPARRHGRRDARRSRTLGEILADAPCWRSWPARTAPRDRPLAGTGAVVTGGGRGIGAAMARALAEAGARVVASRRAPGEVERVAAQLRGRRPGLGGRLRRHRRGVGARAGRRARERLGHVDILVNNAGAAASAPLSNAPLADWNACSP